MDPVAFQLGPYAIHWYGILVAAGFFLGLWTAQRRAPHTGIQSETVSDIGLWLIVGGLVGARLLYVISYWKEDFAGRPLWDVFKIRDGGLVFYGGFLGAVICGMAYAAWKKIPTWRMADILAPSIALGQGFGRLGCLMTGCCYGRKTDFLCAIKFPQDHETKGAPVHPTQIYESLGAFALYGFLAWIYRRKKFDGQVFALYLILYALLRSAVELLRGDYPSYGWGWVTPAHKVSAGLLVAGIILWAWQRKKPLPARP